MSRKEIMTGAGEEPVPQFVGGYSVLARLSNHKATAVYRAYDGTNRRDVCIKQLTKAGAASKSNVAAMEREVRYGRVLAHPGLIEFYAYNTENPRHFFVMEYFEPGATLSNTHVSGEPPFPPPPLKPILTQVLDTLSYVHSQGLVHRDIKPDNILVNEEGCIKLIDFSVAFEKKMPAWKRLLGMRNKVVGTRTYMPPEQIEGRDVDARADLYSFGIMMFEMLAGRAPFNADRPDALLRMHMTTPVPPLHQANRDVTPEASQLVARLMAKDPNQRPAKAEEVLYHIQRVRLKFSDPE